MVDHRSRAIDMAHSFISSASCTITVYGEQVGEQVGDAVHKKPKKRQVQEVEVGYPDCPKCKGLGEFWDKYAKTFYACPKCRGLTSVEVEDR